MLGISIGLNAVSSHATCTAVYVAVAAIVAFLFASIQTLGRISWLAWVGLFCILTSSEYPIDYCPPGRRFQMLTLLLVLIVTVAVGIQDRPSAAPTDAVWVSDYKIVGSSSFSEAISAVSTIIFAYAGTPAFFSIASEMRDPTHYNRALITCQSVVTCFYIAIGIVIYYYCGSYVSSPALGSAGPIVKKVSYGFALPGLIVSTLLFVHVSTPNYTPPTENISFHPKKIKSCTDTRPDHWKIHFRPHALRLPPSHRQHREALGHLARLHLRCNPRRLHHRQRDPRFRRPRLSGRCLARHPDVLPAHGWYVAVR